MSSLELDRLVPIPSQVLLVYYNSIPLSITLDSGATVSYIKISEANRLRLNILPNNQLALLADRKTRMASLGEIDIVVQLNGINLRLRALVMEDLQANCSGEQLFMWTTE